MVREMTKTDYYDILGVPRTATAEQIRAAHRAQSRLHHPDTADNGCGNPNLFTVVQEAYEVLANPDTRRRYDCKETVERGQATGAAPRRPTKTPCGVCKKPVYASQLTLYLGRHMCNACLYRKQQRDANRPRLSVLGEFFWRLKCMRVWVQSHFAVVLLILIACGAAGGRLAMVHNRVRRPDRPATPASNSETTDAAATTTPVVNPCKVPPINASESADVRAPHDSDKR